MGWGTWAKIIGKGALAFGTGGASLAMPGVGLASMVGDATSAASKSMASNRGAKTAAMLDQDRLLEEQLLAREAEKRHAQSSAYRSAMVGSHGVNYAPSMRPAGVPGSYQSTATTPEGRAAAGTLYSEGMRRLLQPDLVSGTTNPILAQDKQRLNLPLDPSVWEKILGIAGPMLSAYGAQQNQKKNQDGTD